MGKFQTIRRSPPSSAAAALALVDMTGATEVNTGNKGANTSFGSTSRFEVKAVQQSPSALDCHLGAVQLTDKPAGAIGVRVLLEVATPDPSPAIGSSTAGFYLFVGTSATVANNSGYLAGFQLQHSPGPRYRAQGVSRMGTNPSGTTIIDTTANADLLYVEIVVYFDASGAPKEAFARVWGESGSTDGLDVYNQQSGLTGTDIYVGMCGHQAGASPADEVDFQGIRVWREWLEKAA